MSLRGEAAAGMSIDFYARVTADIRRPGPHPIFRSHKRHRRHARSRRHPRWNQGPGVELSNHFIEFLMSREGQLLWILKTGVPGGPVERSLRRTPIRRDLYGPRESRQLDRRRRPVQNRRRI